MRQCAITATLNKVDDEDRAALGAVLVNEQVSASKIASLLRDAGYQVSDETLRRHRRQQCGCFRKVTS